MPDWADRPEGDDPAQWPNRELHPPGSYWKYNDVRINLLAYSLLTDYSIGARRLISMRAHLVLDAVAALALIAAPLALGFGGVPRAFYFTVGIAVLLVVAVSDPGPRRSAPSELVEASA